jgi:DNA-binding response OmpR family regulator
VTQENSFSGTNGAGDHEGPKRILVLDDEPLILLDLECAVADAGCVPLTALEPDEALEILDVELVCAAILDVSLGQGKTCEPVARALAARGVPYVLHTGDVERLDMAVRDLGGILVPKPTPASVVVTRALQCAYGDARRI